VKGANNSARSTRGVPPGLVTPELFESAFGLLANLYQEQ
jgi:hypothetical protein